MNTFSIPKRMMAIGQCKYIKVAASRQQIDHTFSCINLEERATDYETIRYVSARQWRYNLHRDVAIGSCIFTIHHRVLKGIRRARKAQRKRLVGICG